MLALIAVAGLIASFHTIIYAYGRQIYSLSRAGYFPRFLSKTHSKRQTPHIALIGGGGLGFVVALIIHYSGSDSPVGAALLNMAVFGAVIAYMLQMLSFILLRIRFPHIERPYRSPLGLSGAVFALIVSAITLVALFVIDPVYRKVVLGAAIWLALGLVYFAVYGKNRLVKSPEEAFALEASQKRQSS